MPSQSESSRQGAACSRQRRNGWALAVGAAVNTWGLVDLSLAGWGPLE